MSDTTIISYINDIGNFKLSNSLSLENTQIHYYYGTKPNEMLAKKSAKYIKKYYPNSNIRGTIMENKYLEKTKMLNYGCKSIQALIKRHKWLELDDYQKIGAIYDFVRNDILFGYNRSDLLTAEEVLNDEYGQCNTKK